MTDPSPKLYFNIIDSVRYQQNLKELRRKLFWQAGGFVISLIFASLCLRLFWQQIAQSEFLQFLLLAKTDFSLIKNQSANFILALVESFPVLNAAFVAGAVLAVLVFSLKSVSTAFKMKHLIRNSS